MAFHKLILLLVFWLVCFSIGCGAPAGEKEIGDSPEVRDSISDYIVNLGKDADELHLDHTPAVHALTEIGQPAIEPLLQVMVTGELYDRMRAQRALEGITMRMYGFTPGRGWTHANGKEDWLKFWDRLGNLQWDSSQSIRLEACRLWKSHTWEQEASKDKTKVPGAKNETDTVKTEAKSPE